MRDVKETMYKLVIVEDEALTREGLRHHFPWSELGFEVVDAFPNGEEALAFIRQHPCHVVITDIMMGQMNGLDLAAQIKSFSPHTKIIILTGYSDFSFTQQAIRNQVSEYLMKPIDDDELMEVFAKLRIQLDEEEADSRLLPGSAMLEVVRKSFLRIMLSGQIVSKNELQAYFRVLGISPETMDYPILAFEIRLTAKATPPIDRDGEIDESKLEDINDVLHQCFVSQDSNLLYDVLDGQNGCWTVVVIALKEMALERLKCHCRDKILYFIEQVNSRNEYAIFHKVTHTLQHIVDLVSNMREENQEDDMPEEALANVGQEYNKLLLKTKVLIAGMDLQQDLFLRMKEEMIRTLIYFPFEEARFLVKNLFSMLLQEYQNRSDSLYQAALTAIDTDGAYAVKDFQELENSLRTALSNLTDCIDQEKRKNSSGTVGLILQYIEENIGSNLSGDVLADKFHLHPSYISRVFKQKTGEKLSEYVERLRLEKSILLLYEGNHRIQDISMMVGYISPSYFSAKFRRYTGYAPREYYYQVLL